MKLFYLNEAKNWNEALPIGNGFLGGMIFGGAKTEKISLNEDSIWGGKRKERHNPEALKNLPRIRQLLFEGKISEAEKLVESSMFVSNPNPAHYEPLGDLGIKFDHGHTIKNYQRTLDLESAIASVTYEVEDVTYKREIFTSAVDHVLVIHLTASRPNSLTFSVNFHREQNLDSIKAFSPNRIMAAGKSEGEEGVSFTTLYHVINVGGKVETIDGILHCEGADEVTLFLTARTDVRDKDFAQWCEMTLDNVLNKSYEELKSRHIKDYQNLYSRVKIDLGGELEKELLPIDKRLELVKKGEEDIGLLALYFQFGRYLLISSSRPGSYPANLQGIWNKDMNPAWGSKYTININAQMNYWLAENCNLSELHEPLFDLIENMKESGRKTAKEMYNCRGFVAHHNTDIFGDTGPVDWYMPATTWVTSIPWLCSHIWEHYLYNGDLDFLEKHYETIKEACLFFSDYLIEDPKGRLVTSPSVSPENTYVLPNGDSGVLCYGPSMDSQIIRQLFSIFLECSSTFSKDIDLSETIKEMLEKLPEPEIGQHGQIMEWAEDYEELEPGHRHISHLFALYPSDQISVNKTPELAKAARVTLERRLASGGGHTGWSRAWIINFWARLLDGNKVYENLNALLAHSTLPNLLDDHPPFQIDGNFGATAGIAEMLLQSHSNEISILPALPKEISNGSVQGLRARGGFEVDIHWKDGFLKKIVIYSKVGNPCFIRINEKILENRESKEFRINTEKNKRYEYTF